MEGGVAVEPAPTRTEEEIAAQHELVQSNIREAREADQEDAAEVEAELELEEEKVAAAAEKTTKARGSKA